MIAPSERDEPRRILHMVNSLRGAGIARQVVELLKGLKSRGEVECKLVVLSDGVFYRDVHNVGIDIHFLPRKAGKDLTILPMLYRIVREFRPHVIHSWEFLSSVYAVPLAGLFGTKFVNGAVRNAPDKLPLMSKLWVRARLTFPFSDLILANSNAGIRSYRPPLRKSLVIHNGFDFNRINHLTSGGEIRRQFGITSPRVVGMVALFRPGKDYATFLSAAMGILSRRDDVSFLLVGEGRTLEACRKLVDSRYRDRIIFAGHQENIESIVDILDVGVMATYTEGISNAIMEYMALGKPVVATRGGGTEELVMDGTTGFLVDRSDSGQLAQRIESLLDDRERALSMGCSGRRRLRDLFDLGRMTENFLDAYDRVCR